MAKNPKKSSGAPRWMATFADLCTLLLTFFVLLLSMANTDVQRFREMLGSVKDAFGVQIEQPGEFQAAISEEVAPTALEVGLGEWERKPETAYENESVPNEPPDESAAKAAEEAKAKEAEAAERKEAVTDIRQVIDRSQMGDQVDVQAGDRGIRIRIKGHLLFEPGSAELRAQAKPFLDNLVMVLQKFPYYLLVEGHTDSTPIATPIFPSNWELSGHRASAVLRYLATWGIPANRMTGVGLSDNYPLDSNETPEGRAQNRRVEFVLTRQSFRPEID